MEKEQTTSAPTYHPHYYGNLIREHLFVAGFVIMVVALLDVELRSFYVIIGLFGVVVFTILAGLTSPSNRAVMFSDMMVSACMFLFFEYFSINRFIRYENFSDNVFLLRQLLAVIFLIVLYYSTKTMRYRADESCKMNPPVK